jgi:hypothetical protein
MTNDPALVIFLVCALALCVPGALLLGYLIFDDIRDRRLRWRAAGGRPLELPRQLKGW